MSDCQDLSACGKLLFLKMSDCQDLSACEAFLYLKMSDCQDLGACGAFLYLKMKITSHPDGTTLKKSYDTQTNDTNDENSANYLAKTSEIDVSNVNIKLTSISDTLDEKYVQSSSKEQTSSVEIEKGDKSRKTTRTNSPTETTPRTDSAYENVDIKLEPKSNTQRKKCSCCI
ncbi:unnamed protein product [Mytilus coruscus]|uniref:Uncharacterized protein n=1 Tax=Mytilus coruscus TaxID=42192 RepID=A0A6J8E847_MYTCO|nr:unnamed protein product [Mytilus coruscus]